MLHLKSWIILVVKLILENVANCRVTDCRRTFLLRECFLFTTLNRLEFDTRHKGLLH